MFILIKKTMSKKNIMYALLAWGLWLTNHSEIKSSPISDDVLSVLAKEDTKKTENNTLDIREYTNKEKTIGFKNQNPDELLSFYRKYISESKEQPTRIKKWRKNFDKILMHIIDIQTLENKEKTLPYTIDIVPSKQDKKSWIIAVNLEISIEKLKDEEVYIPKMKIEKTHGNSMISVLCIKPDLSISRDRRVSAFNDKREKYFVTFTWFQIESYSKKNPEKVTNKFVEIESMGEILQDVVDMVQETKKETKKRIHKEKIQQQQEQRAQEKSKAQEEKSKAQEEKNKAKHATDDIHQKLQERQPREKRNYDTIKQTTKKEQYKKQKHQQRKEIKEKNKAVIKKILQHNQEAVKKNKELIKELIQQNITTPQPQKPVQDTIISQDKELPTSWEWETEK